MKFNSKKSYRSFFSAYCFLPTAYLLQAGRFFSILAIPFLFVLLCLRLKFATGPYYLGPNNDPSYLYLMNSLYLLDGRAPGFIQHPGTTLQIFGAIIIQLFQWGHPFVVVVENVFRDPEFYLHRMYYLILGLNALSLVALGWYAVVRTGNLILGIVIQSSAFLIVNWNTPDVLTGCIPVVANINAENFLISMTNVYGILLLKLYFDEQKNPKAPHTRVAVLMGFLCATGFVTKILFLAWVLMPFLLFFKRKEQWVFAGTFLLGVGLWIIPIIKSIPGFFWWHWMAMTHTGVHGAGAKGFIDIHLYEQGIRYFLTQNVFYFSFVTAMGALAIGSLFVSQQKSFASCVDTLARRYLIMLCWTVLFSLLLMARQPNSHYVVPTLNFFGVICFFAYQTWLARREKRFFIWLLLAVMIVANVFLSLRMGGELTRINKDIYDFSQKVYSDYKDATICSYYRSSSPSFALQFGDDNQGYKAYTDVLHKVYPNACFYHVWNRYFHDGRDIIYYDQMLTRSSRVLLYGSALGDDFNQGFIRGHKIASARTEVLYQIDEITVDEALRAYVSAKHYEGLRQYSDAYVFAKKAKELGFREIDPYLKSLLKAIIGDPSGLN